MSGENDRSTFTWPRKSEEEDLEKQPLLSRENTLKSSCEKDETSQAQAGGQKVKETFNYDAQSLLSPAVIFQVAGTVWECRNLYRIMRQLFLIAVVVCLITDIFVKEDIPKLRQKLTVIIVFLRTIVGVLLGFFLLTCITRWYACSRGFLEFFDSIRCLQMQLEALGVPRSRTCMLLRYCILSANLLDISLEANGIKDAEAKQRFMKDQWDSMMMLEPSSVVAFGKPHSLCKVFPKERALLEKMADPTQSLWVWVTSLIARMSADGEIPPMASPTYVRIIGLTQKAQAGICGVRTSISVQPPYAYAHIMSAIVMLNNIMTAISFGLNSGIELGSIMHGRSLLYLPWVLGPKMAFNQECQDFMFSILIAFAMPGLYQALLEASMALSNPFAHSGDGHLPGRIPAHRLLVHLEQDLRDAALLTSNLPTWEQQHFKEPPSY
eukprot:TRINITY_DN41361_c0_g1_i1.p1 TRINITY_DN41361_c0_g1~~TRINITY_DN41361_c0_g1_i1.p1  ORF type:complete len:438 (+),score=54.10 TRINITY_DN41361_c0_g1_i1:93-1406(+)